MAGSLNSLECRWREKIYRDWNWGRQLDSSHKTFLTRWQWQGRLLNMRLLWARSEMLISVRISSNALHCPVLKKGYGQIGKHNRSWDQLIMKCCSGTIQSSTRPNPLNENIFDSKSTCSKLSYHLVKSPHAFIIKMQIIRWWEKEVFLVAALVKANNKRMPSAICKLLHNYFNSQIFCTNLDPKLLNDKLHRRKWNFTNILTNITPGNRHFKNLKKKY